MSHARTIQERIHRWRRFYEGDPHVPFLVQVSLAGIAEQRPLLWPSRTQERIDWALRKYEQQMHLLELVDDDTVPYLDVATGTEIFAEAFGCRVHRPETDMPFALPFVETEADARALRVPVVSESSLAVLFDIADSLRERADSEALVRLPDIQSPLDIAALIWKKEQYYMRLLEEPGPVLETAAKVSQLLCAFLDTWFARYGVPYVAHYPDYLMFDGMTLSEDEVGAVSEELFEEHFLPELVSLSRRYGGIGVHCCAHATHQWRFFRRLPGLRLLNLVQPEPVLEEAYEYFADTCAQLHSWYGNGEPWTWPSRRPRSARIVYQVQVADEETARRVADGFREALQRA